MMGSGFTCFRVAEDPDHPPENNNARNCNIKIKEFFHTLFNKCTAKFNKEDIQASNISPEDITRQQSDKLEAELSYLYASKDDEDVCPICLEEYSLENPRIVTQCNHYYHLGCTYEWKERSIICPLCFKVLVFDKR